MLGMTGEYGGMENGFVEINFNAPENNPLREEPLIISQSWDR
ncbi:MAG TPA: hypothetical protein VFD57_07420 [Clostridia bacterium]|nr:hypothetical protein [Clostridia bacterium]